MTGTAALLALAALGAGCERSGQEDVSPAAAQPNFVVIMTDDQDIASVRHMPRVQTHLAAKGTTFVNTFATLPLCCPSRATFLTGQYAHNHGVFDNKPPEGGYPAFQNRRRTLGTWLQATGYRTAWVGKYLNGYGLEGRSAVPPGWSRWFVPMGLDSLLMYGYSVSEDGRVRGFGHESADYQTDVLADQATKFIERAGDDPFFLVLAPLAPHDEADTVDTGGRDPRPAPRHVGAVGMSQLPDPPSFNEGDISDKPAKLRAPALTRSELGELRRLNRDRRESLLAVDSAVGRIVRTVERSGLQESTFFVFTSDNGYLLGQHRLVGGKSLPYRGVAGVPLIVRGPGFAPGTRDRRIVGNIDLAPTIAELAQLEPDRRMDGISLMTSDGGAGRALLLESDSYSAIRTIRFLYVEHRSSVELYDLRNDPFELENVGGDARYRAAQRRLARKLESLRLCAGAACRATMSGSGPSN